MNWFQNQIQGSTSISSLEIRTGSQQTPHAQVNGDNTQVDPFCDFVEFPCCPIVIDNKQKIDTQKDAVVDECDADLEQKSLKATCNIVSDRIVQGMLLRSERSANDVSNRAQQVEEGDTQDDLVVW